MDEFVDIQGLIDSGDLELYVLGALPETQMRQITALAAKHPALQQEIQAVEQALMHYAEGQHDREPGEQLLLAAMAAIEPEASSNQTVVDPPSLQGAEETPNEGRVLTFRPRWAWVAAITLLLVSVVLNLLLYSDLEQSETALLAMQRDQQLLATENQQLTSQLDQSRNYLALLQSPAAKRIDLGPVPNREGAATVVWQPQTAEVLLVRAELPEPPTGFQYQLWAIIDGQPVDAGLIEGLQGLQYLNPIGGEAAAFAITLEPVGGSVNPTLEEMYVFGEVS